MKYEGVVIRMNEQGLFLFVLDPNTLELLDGLSISEHECYKDMDDTQLMVVNVIFKDGTEVLEEIDLDEFIYGDKYGVNNIFLEIKDIMLYSISDEGIKMSLNTIAKRGELGTVALECIKLSNNIKPDIKTEMTLKISK